MLERAQIQRTAADVGVSLSDAQADQFSRYAALLVEWNALFNLTAITDDAGILGRHIADSLSAVRVLPAISGLVVRMLDVGTGAGFPGLALKIALPHMDVTVMDSTGKKIAFCQTVIDALGLKGARAVKARAEEAAHDTQHREAYDIVIARAVAPLATLTEYLAPFTRVGGVCVAMKGADAEAELAAAGGAIAALGAQFARIVEVTLPGLADRRALVVIDKITPTRRAYPRQGGAPRNAPLK